MYVGKSPHLKFKINHHFLLWLISPSNFCAWLFFGPSSVCSRRWRRKRKRRCKTLTLEYGQITIIPYTWKYLGQFKRISLGVTHHWRGDSYSAETGLFFFDERMREQWRIQIYEAPLGGLETPRHPGAKLVKGLGTCSKGMVNNLEKKSLLSFNAFLGGGEATQSNWRLTKRKAQFSDPKPAHACNMPSLPMM